MEEEPVDGGRRERCFLEGGLDRERDATDGEAEDFLPVHLERGEGGFTRREVGGTVCVPRELSRCPYVHIQVSATGNNE